MFCSHIKIGNAGEPFHFILSVPSQHPPWLSKVLLHGFIWKEKGEKSSRGDKEWQELAKDVDKFTMASNDHNDDTDTNTNEQDIDDNDNLSLKIMTCSQSTHS